MKKRTLKEIEQSLEEGKISVEIEEDQRVGVQKLLARHRKQQKKEEQIREHYLDMSKYEQKLYSEGVTYIAGVDEVGRGPLAGPVVAAAVILPSTAKLYGINDSKKLSETKRNEFAKKIQQEAVAIGIGIVSSEEIDEINIYEATKKAMLQAISQIERIDHLLIDAMHLKVNIPQTAIIHGDACSISIAAASIIAKVTRDKMMKELSIKYPQYGFDRHMGYGTKAHIEALQDYGIIPEHRRSFSPIKEMTQ